MVEFKDGKTWVTVLAPETESYAPRPVTAVIDHWSTLAKPDDEITLASGSRFTRGERWSSSRRELILVGTARCRRRRKNVVCMLMGGIQLGGS